MGIDRRVKTCACNVGRGRGVRWVRGENIKGRLLVACTGIFMVIFGDALFACVVFTLDLAYSISYRCILNTS